MILHTRVSPVLTLLCVHIQGADTVVWLAIAEKAKGVTGKYFFDRKSRRKNKLGAGTASTPEELQQLVNTCDEAYKS